MKDKILNFVPTREWIESLSVGDFAPNCFGDLREVKEIYHRREDIHGKLFVCTKLEYGERCTISQSFKESERHYTVFN